MFENDEFSDSFGNVPEESFLKVKAISKFKKFGPNIQLDALGKVPSKLYLLLSGVMRCYVISESGKEFNKRFFFL